MPRSTLVVYEPLTSLTEKSYYWSEYVTFYEQYWGGPTSPFGVWFGNEYESFVNALAVHMGVDKEEIEHCFFTKDEEGRYYVAPFKSKSNLFFSEDFIPLEWFVMFGEGERQTLYTHWGFNALHYDTRIHTALGRLEEAAGILSEALREGDESAGKDDVNTLEYLAQALGDLRGWLTGYDPSGFLVLNYGDICAVINPYSLERERSVEDVWRFLGLLRERKFPEAFSSLKALLQKWDDIRSSASGRTDDSTLQ